jgi:hypothetical protein
VLHCGEANGAFDEGTVCVFNRNLHSRMTLSFAPLLRVKCCQACDQRHASRVLTHLTGWHCKFHPNTEDVSPPESVVDARWWENSAGDSGASSTCSSSPTNSYTSNPSRTASPTTTATAIATTSSTTSTSTTTTTTVDLVMQQANVTRSVYGALPSLAARPP